MQAHARAATSQTAGPSCRPQAVLRPARALPWLPQPSRQPRLAVGAVCSSSFRPPPEFPATNPKTRRRLRKLQPGQQPDEAAKTAVDKAPNLPVPAYYQQTLRSSFTLGGVGLHSGKYATVRVRPACPNEGRYFVRVPEGTLEGLFVPEQPHPAQDWELSGDVDDDPEADDLRTRLFFDYLRAQEEEDYDGAFSEYLDELGVESAELFPPTPPPDEAAAARRPDEAYIQASLERVHDSGAPSIFRTELRSEDGSLSVESVEALLAALEQCGVDDARIEIEGGSEVPVIDGSAAGWAIEVQRVGVRPAGLEGDDPDRRWPKTVPVLDEVLTVREGAAFITFYPAPTPRLTVGFDYRVEPAGRQWFDWDPVADDHFRWQVAPARVTLPSQAAAQALLDMGMLQAGPMFCVNIGWGGINWHESTQLRFPADEGARHGVLDLAGDLSLLAQPGGVGLPVGHIVAYQPDHRLQARFARELRQRAAYRTAEPELRVEPLGES